MSMSDKSDTPTHEMARLIDEVASLSRELAEARAECERLREDEARLNAVRDNYWRLDCFQMPTGAGDADVGWKVIEYHMAAPTERVVAGVSEDNPRAAIDAARNQ